MQLVVHDHKDALFASLSISVGFIHCNISETMLCAQFTYLCERIYIITVFLPCDLKGVPYNIKHVSGNWSIWPDFWNIGSQKIIIA